MGYNYYSNFQIDKIDIQRFHTISGWLSNKGKFIACHWGEHTDLAYDLVEQDGFYDELDEIEKHNCMINARDFLVKDKKYILLDNPTMNERTQVIHFNPLTRHPKVQINKLFKLFETDEIMTEYLTKTFLEE